MKKLWMVAAMIGSACMANAQTTAKPEDTEFYTPVPKVVTPGKNMGDPPSDAIILFDGANMNKWAPVSDSSKPVTWNVAGGIVTVDKTSGSIQTKQSFVDYQLHIEWRIPQNITGTGQARGNSGVFLASTGKGDAGYELQVLDSYNNATYTNGQAGSIYKQHAPLSNANRPPGAWNVYDVIWTAPRFNTDGTVKTPAKATVLMNGVAVQNAFELQGETAYIGKPQYRAYTSAPIKLQAHGDKSEPISFRNIWVRPMEPQEAGGHPK